MAEAFRGGNLGIMDYLRMKNIQSDTGMRDAIAGTEKPGKAIDSPEAHSVDGTTCHPPADRLDQLNQLAG